MSKKNKQNTTQTVDTTPEANTEILQVKEQTYQKGDIVKAYNKTCKVVEVLDAGRYHCKNTEMPFDSFVVLGSEIQ